MKKYLLPLVGLLILIVAAFFAVNYFNDNTESQSIRSAALEKAQQQAQRNIPAPKPAQNQSGQKVMGAIPLTLMGSNKKVKPGKETCVAVSTRDFNKILSMQYTIDWDIAVLKFKRLQNFGLPYLTEKNFGKHLSEKGKLTFSWYDMNVAGISVPNGQVLYEVCFDVIGKSGSSSPLKFTDQPVTVEITNGATEFLELNGVFGKVRVQ